MGAVAQVNGSQPVEEVTPVTSVKRLAARTLFVTSLSDESTAEKPGDERPEGDAAAVRVLIADDHEAVRRGLRSALWGAGWQVCGEATNGREAIAKAQELTPDVVILDVSMPVMGGLEAAPEILKASPHTKVVAFTMHESQQIRNEMLRLGVHGVAIKSAPLSKLLDTIKSVLKKEREG
jgi:CheY-like chemotaxis protein